MPLDFPASPTDGQVYQNWIYSTAKGAWQAKPMVSAKTVTSDVAPSNPANGDEWLNTLDGCLYIYYVDVDGGQWVQVKNDASFSTELGPTVDALNAGANTNYIINGAFDIWQRGTSFSFSAANNYAYTADRWWIWSSGTASNCTISQQTFTPGNMPPGATESQYFLRFATTTITSSNIHSLWQKIEDVRTLAGQTVTLSFWAKADATRNFGVRGDQLFGAGGSTELAFGISGSFTATTAWQRFTATFTYPSISGKTIGAGSSTNILFDIPQVNGSTFDIWGVQLQAGSKATSFHRAAPTLQAELAACQRYFQRWTQPPLRGVVTSATVGARMGMPLTVPMRTTPSGALTGILKMYDGSATPNISSLGTNYSTSQTAEFDIPTAGGLTVGRAAVLYQDGTGYIDLSAEL